MKLYGHCKFAVRLRFISDGQCSVQTAGLIGVTEATEAVSLGDRRTGRYDSTEPTQPTYVRLRVISLASRNCVI